MTQLARFKNYRNEMIPSWFSDDLDVLFRNFFEGNSCFMPAIKAEYNYPVDTYETESDYNIDIAVAGIDKDDITIEEEDGILQVSYNKQEEDNTEDKHYIRQSIARRSFNFGWKISNEKFNIKGIKAEMDKGVLKIKIPKIKEEEKPIAVKNKIEIK